MGQVYTLLFLISMNIRVTYQIALQSKDSVLYVQKAKIGEFECNGSQKRGFVSEGFLTFLHFKKV